MKHILLCLTLLCSMPIFGICITHGPYICDMDSVSATIVWITDKPGLSWLELAGPDDLHFYGTARRKVYDTFNGRKMICDSVHRVRVMGLTPNTTYRYRVITKELMTWKVNDLITYGALASNNIWRTPPYHFRTFPASHRDLRFLVLNDIHERADYMRKLCRDIDFSKLDFVVLNGDMSNSVESQDQICKGYLDTCVAMFAKYVPIFFNRGNHETRGRFADYLYRYFPTSTGKYYGLRNICGFNFLFIDSGEDKPDDDIEYCEISDFDNYRMEQVQWLRGLQRQGVFGREPLIVFSHIPPTLQKWHGPINLKQTILPVLNELNVSVMLSGHLHKYAFQEADDIIHFPNLANSNMNYLLCQTRDDVIDIDCAGLNGKDRHHFSFALRQGGDGSSADN